MAALVLLDLLAVDKESVPFKVSRFTLVSISL